MDTHVASYSSASRPAVASHTSALRELMYTVAIETEGKLVNGRNKPTWKQAESYALALHNQVSTGHLGGAAVVILDDKAVEVKRFGAGRR